MKLKPVQKSIDDLLLDPNNYRFHDMKGYVKVSPKRYHENNVQERAERLLLENGETELRALKESINENGYIPLETLIVKAYPYQKGKYVVIEGNRRVAAIRWIKRDKEHGVDLPADLIRSLGTLPVIILDKESLQGNLAHVMMGLRHVTGVKQWGSYQRAQLIVELVDDLELSISDAAKSISMTTHEATRRYRAFKALSQMQGDDEFGEYASPELYTLFHEAVAQPRIREWLDWEDNKGLFQNEEYRREFYKLLIPYLLDDTDDDATAKTEPKLKSKDDVRSLKDILGNEDAEECLLDPSQSLSDALAIVKISETARWVPKLKSAYQALETLPVETLKNLSEEEIKAISGLHNALEERIKDWEKLTGKKMQK